MAKFAYEPHKIARNQLRPLKDTVLVSNMEFKERITSGGIFLLSDNGKSSGIRPRWGQVYVTGPEQTDVAINQWVCIAHGRWTRGIEVEDENGRQTIRKIDPNDILLVSDTKPNDDSMSQAVLT